MKVKYIKWDETELIFENVTIEVVKKNLLIKFENNISSSDIELSKVEITFPHNGEFDAIIKEW